MVAGGDALARADDGRVALIDGALPGERVRVEVTDDGSDHAPIVHPVGEDRESGFGLELVELMADRWGHCGGRRGRVVGFMLEWKADGRSRSLRTGPR